MQKNLEREQADQALSLIRKVVDQTRDDLVAQNWGLLWMLHSFSNLAAFVAIGLVVEARGLPLPYYLLPLIVAGGVNGVFIVLLSKRDQGLSSFVEQQMHGIWGAFILGTGVAGLSLHLAHAPPALFVYVVALTSGTAFAMMGTVFTPKFFGIAAAFALLMASFPFFPSARGVGSRSAGSGGSRSSASASRCTASAARARRPRRRRSSEPLPARTCRQTISRCSTPSARASKASTWRPRPTSTRPA